MVTTERTERSYFFGTGRRKEAVARDRVHPGASEFVVNGKPIGVYFPRMVSQMVATEPLRAAGVEGRVGVTVKVLGGGMTGTGGEEAEGGEELSHGTQGEERRVESCESRVAS